MGAPMDRQNARQRDLIRSGVGQGQRAFTTDSAIVPLYVRTTDDLGLALNGLMYPLIQVRKSEMQEILKKEMLRGEVLGMPSMWCRQGVACRVWPRPNHAYTFVVQEKSPA